MTVALSGSSQFAVWEDMLCFKNSLVFCIVFDMMTSTDMLGHTKYAPSAEVWTMMSALTLCFTVQEHFVKDSLYLTAESFNSDWTFTLEP